MAYLRNSIAYGHDFWNTCVKWWCLMVLFSFFFFILVFWSVKEVKGQKIAQNDKKFCLLCFISQKSCMWLSFMLHLCEIIIFSGIFFIFSKFWVLLVDSEGGGGRGWSKTRKNHVCCTPYLKKHISYDFHLWYTCMCKIISSGVFSFFQNFDFSGC